MKEAVILGNTDQAFTVDSLANKVYGYLESGIVNMKLVPGTILNESDIAGQLSISRSPVREAVLRLEQAGLVVKMGKFRVVASITQQEIKDIYQIWEMLEPLGAADVCEYATYEEIKAVEYVLRSMENSTPDDNITVYRELNCQFHTLLVAPSKNVLLLKYHGNIINRIRWCSNYSLKLNETAWRSNVSHHEIFDAYCRKDKETLERVLKKHIRDASVRIEKRLFSDTAGSGTTD